MHLNGLENLYPKKIFNLSNEIKYFDSLFEGQSPLEYYLNNQEQFNLNSLQLEFLLNKSFGEDILIHIENNNANSFLEHLPSIGITHTQSCLNFFKQYFNQNISHNQKEKFFNYFITNSLSEILERILDKEIFHKYLTIYSLKYKSINKFNYINNPFIDLSYENNEYYNFYFSNNHLGSILFFYDKNINLEKIKYIINNTNKLETPFFTQWESLYEKYPFISNFLRSINHDEGVKFLKLTKILGKHTEIDFLIQSDIPISEYYKKTLLEKFKKDPSYFLNFESQSIVNQIIKYLNYFFHNKSDKKILIEYNKLSLYLFKKIPVTVFSLNIHQIYHFFQNNENNFNKILNFILQLMQKFQKQNSLYLQPIISFIFKDYSNFIKFYSKIKSKHYIFKAHSIYIYQNLINLHSKQTYPYLHYNSNTFFKTNFKPMELENAITEFIADKNFSIQHIEHQSLFIQSKHFFKSVSKFNKEEIIKSISPLLFYQLFNTEHKFRNHPNDHIFAFYFTDEDFYHMSIKLLLQKNQIDFHNPINFQTFLSLFSHLNYENLFNFFIKNQQHYLYISYLKNFLNFKKIYFEQRNFFPLEDNSINLLLYLNKQINYFNYEEKLDIKKYLEEYINSLNYVKNKPFINYMENIIKDIEIFNQHELLEKTILDNHSKIYQKENKVRKI